MATKLRWEVLIAIKDGKPHEVSELYGLLHNKIPSEAAARLFKPNAQRKLDLQERILRGKIRLIIKELGALANQDNAILLGGEGLQRSYQLTEKGILLATQRAIDVSSGDTERGEKRLVRRETDDETKATRRELWAGILFLLDNDKKEWEQRDVVRDLIIGLVPDHIAIKQYTTYCMAKDPQAKPKASQIVYGARRIFTDVISDLIRHKLVEKKTDEATGNIVVRFARPETSEPVQEPEPHTETEQHSPVILQLPAPVPEKKPDNDPPKRKPETTSQLQRFKQELLAVMKSEDIDTWLDTPNNAFGDCKPIDFVIAGDWQPLYKMLFYLESGVGS